MVHTLRALATAVVVCLAAYPITAQPACPTPQIVQTGGPNPTCAGVPVTLDAGAGWASYAWSNGATTRLMTDTPSATTAYSVTTTDANGCSATSQPFQVVVAAAPGAPTIALSSTSVCRDGVVSASDTSSTSWATRQWSVTNGTIAHDYGTSVDVTPDGGGDVTVVLNVTDANGCPASATATATLRSIPPLMFTIPTENICPGPYGGSSINPPADSSTTWTSVAWTRVHSTIT